MDASEHGAQADNTLPCFGISEVADMTGISAFTIRYYDKCGFFPELARDARGVRTFSQSDVAQLYFVDALRKSGLSIEGIQYYVKLQRRGAATRDERLAIVRASGDGARVPASRARRELEAVERRRCGIVDG